MALDGRALEQLSRCIGMRDCWRACGTNICCNEQRRGLPWWKPEKECSPTAPEGDVKTCLVQAALRRLNHRHAPVSSPSFCVEAWLLTSSLKDKNAFMTVICWSTLLWPDSRVSVRKRFHNDGLCSKRVFDLQLTLKTAANDAPSNYFSVRSCVWLWTTIGRMQANDKGGSGMATYGCASLSRHTLKAYALMRLRCHGWVIVH